MNYKNRWTKRIKAKIPDLTQPVTNLSLFKIMFWTRGRKWLKHQLQMNHIYISYEIKSISYFISPMLEDKYPKIQHRINQQLDAIKPPKTDADIKYYYRLRLKPHQKVDVKLCTWNDILIAINANNTDTQAKLMDCLLYLKQSNFDLRTLEKIANRKYQGQTEVIIEYTNNLLDKYPIEYYNNQELIEQYKQKGIKPPKHVNQILILKSHALLSPVTVNDMLEMIEIANGF